MAVLNVIPDGQNIAAMAQARKILNLPEGKRRTLMRSWGRKIRKAARDNTQAQRNVDGSRWAGRKPRQDKIERDEKGRRKNSGKMLKNITKGKHLNVKTLGNDAVEVDWANSGIGRLAREHQEGMDQFFKMSGDKNYGGGKYDQPATDRQAKALIVSGYKIRKARKLNWNEESAYKKRRKNGASEWVTPSKAWIKRNIKMGQAGLILHELGYSSAKRSWTIERPSRSFLGASKEQVTDMLDEVYEAMLERKRNK
jgi:phage virion morphogenesis protein